MWASCSQKKIKSRPASFTRETPLMKNTAVHLSTMRRICCSRNNSTPRSACCAIVELKEDDEEGRVLLAQLLLVHGDVQEALVVAKTTRDRRLKANLYLRTEDWAALLKEITHEE